jgi:hypothetical protein
MSDFGLGGLFSAGGAIVGGMMQADAQDRATQANIGINWDNIAARAKEIREAREYAEKLRREGKLGTTDIRGTTTKFVPGKGWVVTGSPELLAMMKAQDAEQMKQLTHDLPQRRSIMDRNFKRSFQDDALADTFRRQLVGTAPAISNEGYASDLYRAMTAGLKDADQVSGSRAYNQAVRTNNTSNLPKIFQAQQKANNASYAQAALQAKLSARGQGERERSERINQLTNLYNTFATRAAALPDTQYRPQPIDVNSNIALAASQNNAANQIGANVMQMQGVRQDYIQPNFGMANAVGGAGAALGSAFTAMGAKKQYDQGYGGGGGQQVAGFGGSGGSGYKSSGYYHDDETG